MKGEPFEKIFGNTVELRLLEFLMSVPKDDFTISELERVTGVSRTSVDRVVKKFKEWGIAREVDRRGNMTMFALNEESPIVKAIYALNGAITEEMYPDLFRGQGSEVRSDDVAKATPFISDGFVDRERPALRPVPKRAESRPN